jgi:hypothetical protein
VGHVLIISCVSVGGTGCRDADPVSRVSGGIEKIHPDLFPFGVNILVGFHLRDPVGKGRSLRKQKAHREGKTKNEWKPGMNSSHPLSPFF